MKKMESVKNETFLYDGNLYIRLELTAGRVFWKKMYNNQYIQNKDKIKFLNKKYDELMSQGSVEESKPLCNCKHASMCDNSCIKEAERRKNNQQANGGSPTSKKLIIDLSDKTDEHIKSLYDHIYHKLELNVSYLKEDNPVASIAINIIESTTKEQLKGIKDDIIDVLQKNGWYNWDVKLQNARETDNRAS